jgi:hypothetical protein
MEEQEISWEKLKQKLLLEEFRYWNAFRNGVCEKFLHEVSDNIHSLRSKLEQFYASE